MLYGPFGGWGTTMTLFAETVSWGQSLGLVCLAGFLTIVAAACLWIWRQDAKQKEHYRKNIERHREHAERSEEHMANVEKLLERIAAALERQSDE